jgi:hypothetical protein
VPDRDGAQINPDQPAHPAWLATSGPVSALRPEHGWVGRSRVAARDSALDCQGYARD